ncbi:DUF998 domain-containing protein [Dictyobacter formicarum]|uniref:DUF998 domain-containing protein n=1 Tax=Dictyobacter formicarum TaxID=2778368 RepID=A0ABQ3VM62_9CHLR|nr:DUF998 domain-containing protein [Dictyobacter formicarum]GHO86977.1 hypothetical protein KSZ_49830 [Dictyobacter formicarum]
MNNRASNHPIDDATTPVPTGNGLAKSVARTTPKTIRWLVLGAIAGPVLFTLAWAILGELSPGYTAWGTRIEPYSPISQPISGLGLGPTAPFMNAAFVLSGLLLLVGVVNIFQSIREMGAFARGICTLLLALSPLGMIADGFFTLESILPHMVGFLLGCMTPVLSFVVSGLFLRRVKSFRRFGTWLLLGSPLTLALTVLYFLTFSPTIAGIQTGVAGLTERILVVEVFAWFVAMGALAFHRLS